MGSVENEILLIKTGMDELSAELQSQSREPMLADIAETGPVEGDEALAMTEPEVSAPPASALAAMRWPEPEDAASPAGDGEQIASMDTLLQPPQTDQVESGSGARDDAWAATALAAGAETAAFTAAIPAEEMVLTVPAYGVQLGAMRRESGARALATMTQLEPTSLFIQAAGSWQFVILGWFAEREEALAAMDALPGSVRQLRPLIRFVDAGARVKPIEGPLSP
jgi:septal ring-binding cell division protein DamX